MKFSDGIKRDKFDIVYVSRTREAMETGEEYNSLLWDFEREGYKGRNTYSTPARDVKIGESIYDKQGRYVTYRCFDN